jgi:hypothetical protein
MCWSVDHTDRSANGQVPRGRGYQQTVLDFPGHAHPRQPGDASTVNGGLLERLGVAELEMSNNYSGRRDHGLRKYRFRCVRAPVTIRADLV